VVIQLRHLDTNAMSEREDRSARNDDTDVKFYTPAVARSPALDRVEAVVERLFDTHGVVLIPDTYEG
jgi:hypothetical protein